MSQPLTNAKLDQELDTLFNNIAKLEVHHPASSMDQRQHRSGRGDFNSLKERMGPPPR